MKSLIFSIVFILLLLLRLRFASGRYAELFIDKLENVETLRLTSVAGPESLAFDRSGGGPYTGVSGGLILKWQGKGLGWVQFAVNSKNRKEECIHEGSKVEMESACGRPLGLQFHRATGVLYIADAYLGLLAVGPAGGPATRLVAAAANGGPLRFTNGVDVDQETGVVYFTDSSTRFLRPDYIMAVITGDSTGRLMRYDPRTMKVTVMRHSLPFPNGVALTADRSSLLVAETGNCRVVRLWLRGPRAGAIDVFADLVGYPDNIKRTPEGDFWVGINMEKVKFMEYYSSSAKAAAGGAAEPEHRPVAAVKLSREGEVLQVLRGGIAGGTVSEVVEKNGTIWIGSVDLPYVGVYKI